MKKISCLLVLFVMMFPIAALAATVRTLSQTLPTNAALIDQFAKPPVRYTAVNGTLFKNGLFVSTTCHFVGDFLPGSVDVSQIAWGYLFVCPEGNSLVLRFTYGIKMYPPQVIGPIAAPAGVEVFNFVGLLPQGWPR